MHVLFYLAAAVAVLASLLVVTRRNAVHALLYLVVSLLAVAVIFLTLNAPFVAALEVIIYAGAIMVLFVFVVMMLNLGSAGVAQEERWLEAGIWRGPVLLTAVLLAELAWILFAAPPGSAGARTVGAQEVGAALFGPYVVGAELAGFLLLAGLVGAYHLGRRKERSR